MTKKFRKAMVQLKENKPLPFWQLQHPWVSFYKGQQYKLHYRPSVIKQIMF